jgi:ABC-2 type transport system ATP-binding protein
MNASAPVAIVTEADTVRGLVSLTGRLASVDEDITGRENLILMARLLGYARRPAKERADELLDAFGIADAAGKQVKHYSGGMRRLDIAASIVVTPRLMFLDEPTTGLDPRSRNQVWEIIRALIGEGTTVLLCTQYLDEADQLADRIAVIDHGRVIAEGTPSQLKASVGQGALHVRLLDPEQRPAPELVLSRTLDSIVHLESDPAALSVAAADAERASEAVAALFEAGIEVGNFSLGQPTLDEVSRTSPRASWTASARSPPGGRRRSSARWSATAPATSSRRRSSPCSGSSWASRRPAASAACWRRWRWSSRSRSA